MYVHVVFLFIIVSVLSNHDVFVDGISTLTYIWTFLSNLCVKRQRLIHFESAVYLLSTYVQESKGERGQKLVFVICFQVFFFME